MQLTTFAVQSFAILQMLVTTFAVTHLQFRLPDNHNKSPMDYLLLYTVAARALAVELLAVFTFAKLHLQFKVLVSPHRPFSHLQFNICHPSFAVFEECCLVKCCWLHLQLAFLQLPQMLLDTFAVAHLQFLTDAVHHICSCHICCWPHLQFIFLQL